MRDKPVGNIVLLSLYSTASIQLEYKRRFPIKCHKASEDDRRGEDDLIIEIENQSSRAAQ